MNKGNDDQVAGHEPEEAFWVRGLADRIKARRKATGKTAEEFADMAGISRSQYSRYETGKDLRYVTLRKIVKGFGITMSEFFEGLD